MNLRPACAWPQKEAEMKYIVIEKPGAVSVKEMEMPVRRKGEALLRLLYGGICGSDLNSYRGGNAYVKYPVKTRKFLEYGVMDEFTHNKSIQKAIESYRIPQEKKDHLRTLKIK